MIVKVRLAIALSVLVIAGLLGCSKTPAGEFTLSSPDGDLVVTLTHDDSAGSLTYRVESENQEIISPSPIGINTDQGDFRSGMTLTGTARKVIDETYTLPQGKVSTYHNHANELVLQFSKNGQEMHVRFRAYNDGVAFRFAIPGVGAVEIYGENSTINLSGEHFTYWGQNHPNDYGYESALGPITGDRMSNPVLAHLEDRDHFVLMGQAATYGSYVQSHFQHSGSSFRYSFPLDQEKLGPVKTVLPFQSPWRMVIISPNDPSEIVESYLVENLNPPTDPALLDEDGTVVDWVKPGRVMWDFLAGDEDQPKMWIDAVAEMGWEYYMADAGFAEEFGGPEAVREATAYAEKKGVGVLGWAHTRAFDTRAKAAETMGRYADWGLKGIKIDFFDHNTLDDGDTGEWHDYEDTQRSLQMRDWIFELAIENELLLELHGNTIPTGERRRYPNLMTLEGVHGMEKSEANVASDLTIPFTRNVMGPVSYTVIDFDRSKGSRAYQLAMPIVYEAGLMIYAEHGETLLEWLGQEMIQDIPAAWDEIKFIEGMPTSHVIIARRKGKDWFIGGMTRSPRPAKIPLDFLASGHDYHALIFRDDTHTTMHRETKTVNSTSTLSIPMLENGGFAVRLSPVTSAAGE